MWKVLILLNLAALLCSVHSVPSPVSVIFSSVNLRNVLQWLPGNGTSSGTHFTVQYAVYGDSLKNGKEKRVRWRSVQRCTKIVQRWCDLSVEMWDVEQGYFARVRAVSKRASSKWAMTRRFDPKSDTSFGPPLVSAEVNDNSAVITLEGPLRYQPNNQTPLVSMATLYPQMMYNLSIYNTRRGKISHITVTSGGYKHGLMDYDTEYCFSAEAKFLSMPVLCQSSAWRCITTPPDPVIVQLRMIVVGIVVPVVVICILVVVCYLLHHYLIGKGHKTPYMLNPTFFNQTILTLEPEKFNSILIPVIQPADLERDVAQDIHPERHRLIADPPPEYAAQVPHDPEQPSDDLASSYGFVEVDPQHDNEKDKRVEHDTREGSDRQRVRLPNASQNTRDVPAAHNDHNEDRFPDDCGVVKPAACDKEKNDDEQEEGTIFVNWDPRTRKLVMPEYGAARKGTNWSLQGDEERESRVEEEEGVTPVTGKLLLENVFVRQASEEEAEAQAKLETGGEPGCEAEEDIWAKWDLVISMDE